MSWPIVKRAQTTVAHWTCRLCEDTDRGGQREFYVHYAMKHQVKPARVRA